MKKVKLNSKLNLKKEQIANLNDVKGGDIKSHPGPSEKIICAISNECTTKNLQQTCGAASCVNGVCNTMGGAYC